MDHARLGGVVRAAGLDPGQLVAVGGGGQDMRVCVADIDAVEVIPHVVDGDEWQCAADGVAQVCQADLYWLAGFFGGKAREVVGWQGVGGKAVFAAGGLDDDAAVAALFRGDDEVAAGSQRGFHAGRAHAAGRQVAFYLGAGGDLDFGVAAGHVEDVVFGADQQVFERR